MAKFDVTGEQYFSITGQMLEIIRQIRLKSGSPIKPELVSIALQNIVEGKFEGLAGKPLILRLISTDQNFTLKALKGDRLIYRANETFESSIDSDFVLWGINKSGVFTPETKVQTHELVTNRKLMEIFQALSGKWSQKWLSQDQVIEFCGTFPAWLRRDGYATFFLVKKDENRVIDENRPEDNLVVICVDMRAGGLHVSVHELEDDDVWITEHLYRVVSPKIIPLDK